MTPTKILVGQGCLVVSIVGGGLWASTQWTAAMLGNQPGLGTPLTKVLGYPLYAPWRLFEWWYAYEPYAPEVFRTAGLFAGGSGIAGTLVAIAGSLWRARQTRNVTTYGSAKWASAEDLKRARLFSGNGVFLGKLGETYLRHDGPEHVLAFAPTRSGKGVGLVIPTLLTWPHSAVIHDIKGENWQLTAGFRSKFSHCLLFNPADPRSARYNPLLEVRKGEWEVRDVQNIADILVDPEGALERRNHWEKTSHALLVGVILHVLYAEGEKTLARVASFMSDPSRSIERTLRVMMSTNHLGTDKAPRVHPVVASVACELLNKSENERSGVLSTAMSFLGLYRDPVVARNTGACDWRIADLMEARKPISLYLVIPPADLSRTKPLVRLILNQIGRRLTESLEGQKRQPRSKLLLMLDEFPALGRLDFFETALAFMAGYGIRAYLIAQSLNQIIKAYGENNSILDNAHVRIAFAANDERTAKRISDSLGTATELRAQKNYAGHRLAPWLAHVMVSRQETARPLLTPGEVMQLPTDEALVLVSGLQPIKAKKLRYFEDDNFKGRVLPPPVLAEGDYADRPPQSPHDWQGQVRSEDTRLEKPWFAQLHGEGGDQGGLKREPWSDEVAATSTSVEPDNDIKVLDDDFEQATANTDPLSRSAAARAYGVERADGDDALPVFER
ncbi:MAG: conjugal transfer protein TraG [Rhizobiales bacterium]|nr:conjugal transfer protein TraG [Hyphomicrobiales bacterium]